MSELLQKTVLAQHLFRNPSIMIFLGMLALACLAVTILGEGFGIGLISTSFIKTLGKTLCLCMIAIAMDLSGVFAGSCPLVTSPFCAWWLHDRHVDDVCSHQDDRYRSGKE